MKRVLVAIVVFFSALQFLYANSAEQKSEIQNPAPPVQKIWGLGKNSVVLMKAGLVEGAGCDDFQILFNEKLAFKITCKGQSLDQKVALDNQKGYTIMRKSGHTTITKYKYLKKKPQISQFEQSILKVPYVEEIINLKVGKEGHLAFYYESFKVDEFGRIVQDKFIQAHGLQKQDIKISSN